MTIDNAKKHRQEFGYQCDALIDSEHRLVKLTGATITPEVAVISPKGQLLDRGPIDRCRQRKPMPAYSKSR